MKKSFILLPLLVSAMVSCNNSTTTESTETKKTDSAVTTAPAKEETPPPPMDSATMAKKMMEYGTPGEMHKMLAASTGKWTAEVTAWMDPSKPPTKSTATADNKMIMNGLYQSSSFKGEMMGMPFEGISTVGYDNSRKVFVSTWIDNMGSGIMYMEGTWDAATKTLTSKGKMTDCTTDKEMEVRETMVFPDDKNQMMTMYCAGPDGKEMKMMEIKYTRK